MTMKWMKLFDSDEISKVMMDGEDNEARMDNNPPNKEGLVNWRIVASKSQEGTASYFAIDLGLLVSASQI